MASMSVKLAEWRAARNSAQLPEHALLKDMLYVIQGIDGKHITFAPGNARALQQGQVLVESGINIDDRAGQISQPTKDLLHRIAELGYLYNKISAAISVAKDPASRIGMIEQSLYHALTKELTSYYRLIAVLESRLSASSDNPLLTPILVDKELEAALPVMLNGETGLTLRRLSIWLEDTKLRMRMMAVLIENCSQAHGGALVSLIHNYTAHGDPFLRQFTDQLLEEVSRPFFVTLAKWIYQGELDDPFHEFFVDLNLDLKTSQAKTPRGNSDLLGVTDGIDQFALEEDAGMSGRPALDAHQIWAKKFGFRSEMVPTFVSESFGRKIFSTGKSLNFIKYSCQDSDWVATRSKFATNDHTTRSLQYSDISGLEQSIDAAYNLASQRLFDIFVNKFQLVDTLTALKDYLLLGKGDFVELLMESLGNSLDRPANTLYRHHLTACLETAIRGSSAAFDQAGTLRRLDARMAENEGEDGDEKSGWQAFMLEYKIDSPLDTIFNPEAMHGYNRLFTQLWSTKRIELATGSAWLKIMTNAKDYAKVSELKSEFHQTRTMLAEIIHFIRQLQYFYHLEVIACAWQDLDTFLKKKQGDLDSLIGAHRSYLDRLITKCLLLIPAKKGNDEEGLLNVLRSLFDLTLSFVNTIESLCNYALAEATRLDALKDEARGLRKAQTLLEPDTEVLQSIRRKLHKYGTAFQEEVTRFITLLASHHDLDIRCLALRLNFSLHYVLGKKKEKATSK